MHTCIYIHTCPYFVSINAIITSIITSVAYCALHTQVAENGLLAATKRSLDYTLQKTKLSMEDALAHKIKESHENISGTEPVPRKSDIRLIGNTLIFRNIEVHIKNTLPGVLRHVEDKPMRVSSMALDVTYKKFIRNTLQDALGSHIEGPITGQRTPNEGPVTGQRTPNEGPVTGQRTPNEGPTEGLISGTVTVQTVVSSNVLDQTSALIQGTHLGPTIIEDTVTGTATETVMGHTPVTTIGHTPVIVKGTVTNPDPIKGTVIGHTSVGHTPVIIKGTLRCSIISVSSIICMLTLLCLWLVRIFV
jgi:hypothetical protein